MIKKNSILEARRYLDNARAILREKALKEDEYYQDEKYVKLAGHAAYAGVLVALDSLLGDKKKGRKEVSWYKEQLAVLDKRVLKHFISAYDLLQLSMSYDGNPETAVAQLGLKRAEEIISWVETRACA
jgi:hypothetical protein